MKNYFLLFIIITSTLTFKAQKISLGPELGVNIIPLENTDYGYNYQLGFHFGGHVKYHISDKFKISTGLFLTQKKKAYQFSDTNSVLSVIDGLLSSFGGIGAPNLNLDSIINIPGINLDMTDDTKGVQSEVFIKIPVLANYKYKNTNFYLGPYFGFLLMANQKEEITTDVPVFDFIDVSTFDSTGFITSFLPSSGVKESNSSGTDGLTNFDVGFNAGIGYEMNKLHFNLMYSQSFFDYRKDRKNDDFSPLRTFRISILYLFDLEKKSTASPRIN